MADILKDSYTLKFNLLFVDGDTRTITLKNPSDTITSADVESLDNWMRSNQPVIGDKWQGAFAKIAEATKVTTNTRELDI